MLVLLNILEVSPPNQTMGGAVTDLHLGTNEAPAEASSSTIEAEVLLPWSGLYATMDLVSISSSSLGCKGPTPTLGPSPSTSTTEDLGISAPGLSHSQGATADLVMMATR